MVSVVGMAPRILEMAFVLMSFAATTQGAAAAAAAAAMCESRACCWSIPRLWADDGAPTARSVAKQTPLRSQITRMSRHGGCLMLCCLVSPFPLPIWRRAGKGAPPERDEDQRGAVGPRQEHHPQGGAACADQGGPGFLRDDAAGALHIAPMSLYKLSYVLCLL